MASWLLLLSLTIAVRDSFCAISSCNSVTSCRGRGSCQQDGTCQCKSKNLGSITMRYYGSSCQTWTSRWLTPGPQRPCSSNCSGNGNLADGKCACFTYFDGTNTTRYHGACCGNSSVSWETNNGTIAVGSFDEFAYCEASVSCQGHGVCSEYNTCLCSKIVSTSGNEEEIVQYFGPACMGIRTTTSSTASILPSSGNGCGLGFACNNRGSCENGMCQCNSDAKGYWSGRQCNQYYYSWTYKWSSDSAGETTDVGTSGCTASLCNNNGVCTSGGSCDCSTVHDNVTNTATEYYTSFCTGKRVYNHSVPNSIGRYSLQGGVWKAAPFIQQTAEWQALPSFVDAACYCRNTSSQIELGLATTCISRCVDQYTCNGHGVCNGTAGNVCSCATNWTGTFCDKCDRGLSSSDPARPSCDICAEEWYPKNGSAMCSTYCSSTDAQWGCGAKGTCLSSGQCQCEAAYTGPYCTRCAGPDYAWTFYPDCAYCVASVSCNGNGICVKGGQCRCTLGFNGTDCGSCASPTDIWPNCQASSIVGGAAAAGTDSCDTDVTLSVLLSAGITLLLCGTAFGVYLVKSKGLPDLPDKKQQWKDDFQDVDDDAPGDYDAL